ncbi:MAG TPA: hypothetical protein VE153_32850 [Myxococcus sp.]|nr:hypothetical protein [Myxococcus sp.]
MTIEIRPRWEGLVFVCRRCTKRARAKRLTRTLKDELGKDVRVVRSGCFKVCPKGRVCVVAGAGERLRWFLVDPKADADVVARPIAAALGRSKGRG